MATGAGYGGEDENARARERTGLERRFEAMFHVCLHTSKVAAPYTDGHEGWLRKEEALGLTNKRVRASHSAECCQRIMKACHFGEKGIKKKGRLTPPQRRAGANIGAPYSVR